MMTHSTEFSVHYKYNSEFDILVAEIAHVAACELSNFLYNLNGNYSFKTNCGVLFSIRFEVILFKCHALSWWWFWAISYAYCLSEIRKNGWFLEIHRKLCKNALLLFRYPVSCVIRKLVFFKNATEKSITSRILTKMQWSSCRHRTSKYGGIQVHDIIPYRFKFHFRVQLHSPF